ncbi:MAG: HD domain-containing protein [Deltaproteobacteria bacterium]|nr:HD domain-containing protein [Deltaproteobacteria bacterium]
MPHTFITDLRPGDKINQFFLVKRKERRRTRTGKDYLDISLADCSGALGAKIWGEAVDQFDPLFAEGQFAGIAGRVESYQDEPQLNIERIKGIQHWSSEQLGLAGFNPDLLIPVCPLDITSLWKDLLTWVKEIQHPVLRELTLSLLENHEEGWKQWPASKLYHHAYKGGLLEHTCRVVQLAREVGKLFPELNQDLVLAGAVLHDIGKLHELEGYLSSHNTYGGQLLGHLTLGWAMIREAAKELAWDDPRLLTQLEHIILAHHGQLEFGSPVLPQTREALMVHMLDDLEGKIKMMNDQLEQDRGEGAFTDWHRVLKRKILKDPKD